VILAIAACLTLAGQGDFTKVFLGDPNSPSTHTLYLIRDSRLDPPKYSPKKFGTNDPQPFEFDWEIDGYGKEHDSDSRMDLKFKVFAQDRKDRNDVSPQVTRMLLHLWDLAYKKFKFEHQELYRGEVDVYLCWGGDPGGEQRMDLDWDQEKPPRQVKVNTIYIYDINSFTNPIEMAREVAHEYGHALLTPVGGFVTPEDWGNGQLGEKLFLMWCRNEMAAGRLNPEDTMGANQSALDSWVHKNVDPLIIANAAGGPEFGLLESQGQGAMDAFTGLVCYADALFGDQVAGLSLKLMATSSAKDYPAALLLACQQMGRVVVSLPAGLKDKDFWAPLGKGKVTGATVIKRNGDWALLRPGVIVTTLIFD
jgi:hypothetical protein